MPELHRRNTLITQFQIVLLQFCRGSKDAPLSLETGEWEFYSKYTMLDHLPIYHETESPTDVQETGQSLYVPENFFLVFSTLSGTRYFTHCTAYSYFLCCCLLVRCMNGMSCYSLPVQKIAYTCAKNRFSTALFISQ